jgi:ATP-binding cassette, subfamily B, bacterial
VFGLRTPGNALAVLRRWRLEASIRYGLLRALRTGGGRPVAGLALSALLVIAAGPASAVLTGRLVGTISSASSLSPVILPVLALVVVLTTREIAEVASRELISVIAVRVDAAVRGRIRRLAMAPPTVAHLDEAALELDAVRASDLIPHWHRSSIGTAAAGQLWLMSRYVGALAAAVVLARYFPLLALGLFAAAAAIRAIIRRQWLWLESVNEAHRPEERQREYWADLAMGREAAKELRLFGLAGWVIGRREELQSRWWQVRTATRRRLLKRQNASILVALAASGSALLVPGLAADHGRLSPAQLASCLVAAWGIFQLVWFGEETFDIDYGSGSLQALNRLTGRIEYAAGQPGHSRVLPVGPAPPRVRFDGVSFSYPSGARPVLTELELSIEPGEVLGVVGINGVGKTTLMKLLAGLYAPTGGQILIDDTSLAEIDLAGWRRRVAMVFQDFVHYPASVRDNIVLSAPECAGDAAGLAEALEQAGVRALVDRLPNGADTGLWRGGRNSVDLSGGQWQKLALARALFAVAHGRQVLVLDEPTAHLDVAAEIAFFDQVVDAVAGRASIVLISHRLSTLRNADRIVVLEDGRVRESGSHAELIDSAGEYARLFHLQSDRFSDAASGGAGS